MNFQEYQQLDGMALAKLVANKEVTAAELLEIAISRADEVNPKLNALIHPLYEQARKQAQAPVVGALSGVPMLVKDYYQQIAGAPHYLGNKGLKRLHHLAPVDDEIVKRWRETGAVIFGRTSTPEFAIKGITEPEAWGACRNPWNLNHTPGGSSGGSAALVAAGVVPFAGANDGGGSIRIPAATAGLFGLKPSRGRTPWGPNFIESIHGMAVNHVVSRSVRDSALLLDLTHGAEQGSLSQLVSPAAGFLAATQQHPKTLRIAYSTNSPTGGKADAEAIKAVENTVKLLVDLGHQVVEAEPPMNNEAMLLDWLKLWAVNCAESVRQTRALGVNSNSDYEADTLVMAAIGESTKAIDYYQAYLRMQHYGQQWDAFLADYDLWLTPTIAKEPAKIGSLATPAIQQLAARFTLAFQMGFTMQYTGLFEKMSLENLRYTPFTQLANLMGTPAMSVPLHWCASGLPLGVQFMAGQGQEELLFSLAAQLEQAQPWHNKHPAL